MHPFRVHPRAAAFALAIAGAFPAVSSAQPIVLPQTVVTATRFPEPSASLPFGVSVITAEEIERSGAASVNEALIRVLGVSGRQDAFGGGEYNLDLRGFGVTSDANQVVIVDGVRLSEADLGGTRLSGIPIESVERIEVLRGSGAVLYGEGATGGVIVITTRAGAGKARPNGATLHAAAGSHRLREVRGTAQVSGGGFDLDASLQKRDSDNHRDNFRSRLEAGSVTGRWTGERVSLGARLAADELDTGLPGALSAAQYAADPRQSSRPTDHARIRQERTGVFAETNLGGWQLAFDAGWREKRLRSLNAGFAYDYDIDARQYALRARHQASIGAARNLFVLGMDDHQWDREVLGAFGSTATQATRAWYAKDDVTLPAGTRLSAGLRTERLEKRNSGATSPLDDRLHAWEVGASHPVAPGVTAYARIGRSFRVANVDEFSFNSPGVALEPQVSRDVELGARWEHGRGRLEARLYRHALEGEIGFDPNAAGAFGFLGANVNFDPSRRQGVELDAAQQLSSTLGLRLNANVREATFRSGPYAGRDVPLVPQRTVALRADWTPAAGHRLSGGLQWVSSQHPDFANACTMPAYTTADARYAYAWRNAEFSLGVTNLTDRKYATQAFGCVAGTTTSIYPEPGRTFAAAVRVKF